MRKQGTRCNVTPEKRLKAVQEYLAGKMSKEKLGKKYNVDRTTISEWILKYKAFGDKAFVVDCNNVVYTAEFKEKVVKAYLNNEGSYKDIAIKYKIHGETSVLRWVKQYNNNEELTTSKREATRAMVNGKGRKTTYEERVEIVKYCFEHKNDYSETALKYRVSYQQIYYWCQRYRSNGIEALMDQRGKTKSTTNMTELEKLYVENKLLRAKSERVQMENDLLKKVKELERWRRI